MSKEMEVFEDSYSHQFIVTNGINLHVVLAGPEEGEIESTVGLGSSYLNST